MHRKYGTLLFAVLSTSCWGQGDPATLDRIAKLGTTANHATELLHHLCKDIGSRRTGSKKLQHAQAWAMAQLKSFGWQNVHLEKWGEVPIGWERGTHYSGRMITPYNVPIEFSSPAWSAGTNGPVRGEAVLQPATLLEFEQLKEKLKGKWVVMRREVDMRGPKRTPMTDAEKQKDPEGAELELVNKALSQAGILGRVYGEQYANNLVHTHGRYADLDLKKLPTEVKVNIDFTDYHTIMRSLLAQKKVELEFNVDQRFIPGAVPQYNVVAEWPGTDKADEFVVFGGHLDSWDGPGSEGASDNGTGSMISLEAARLIAASQAKPRRSLRIMLFSGEEQGLLGSAGDCKLLGDQLSKIDAMFVEDGGSNWQSSIGVIPAWQGALEDALKKTNETFPDKQIKVVVSKDNTWPKGAGTDHASYLEAGVPGLSWGKSGKQTYFYIWHTQHDIFENAIPENLVQMSTNTALVVFNIASREERLYRRSDAGK